MPSQKIFKLAIAKQSAKGVAATAAQFLADVNGGDLMPLRNVQDFAETGASQLPRTAFVASTGVDGAPVMGVRDDLAGLMLWGALGTKAVANAGLNTTLAAQASVGATNIKVTAVTGAVIGDTILIGTGATRESRVLTGVGTAGAGGTGLDFATPLVNLQANGAPVVEDPYLHTITPANSTPYFTCWVMRGDLIWEKMIDCKIAQLEFVSEAEQAMIMTVTIVGARAQSLSQATYNTEVAGAPLSGAGQVQTGLYVHHYGSGLLLAEGVAISRMERVQLTIARGTARQYGDSVFADDITEGAMNITVATRQRVAAAEVALYNRLHYGTAAPASGTDPTGTILELGAGGLDLMWRRQVSPERSIRFQSGPRVQVTGIGGMAPGTGDDPLKAEPTYRVMEPDSGTAFTALVRNDQPSY